MRRDAMRIGAVARAAGVNVQTLRYYERRGLLDAPERLASGHRCYSEDAVDRVRFIKRAQALGFSLDEIQSLLELRAQACCERSESRALAIAKMADVDDKIRHLRAVREALAELVRTCEAGFGQPRCPIIEALNAS